MELHHFAVQVHDLEGAVRWYRELLELPLLREWHDDKGALRSVWLRLSGDAFLALERCARPPETKGETWADRELGYHLVAFRIAPGERLLWEQRLAERGVPIEHRTQWTVYFRDPEGNRIGLSHHPEDKRPGSGNASAPVEANPLTRCF
jgi:glyoxylase I family protein